MRLHKKGIAVGLLLVSMLCLNACGNGKKAKENYKAGMELFEKGKYEEAVTKFVSAVKENTEKAEYYIAYGMALIETGDYDNAQIQFDKAILEKENQIVRENNKQAYRGKGISYYEAKEYDKAIEEFNKALEISDMNELNVDILSYKADAESKIGDYRDALKTYTELLEKKKNDAIIYGKKAQVEYALGEYEQAEKDFDKAIRLQSNNYDVYFGKYNMLLNQGRTAEAEQILKEALVIKTKTDEDYFNVAKVHYFQKDYKTAEGELSTAAEKGFVEAWYYLGQIKESQEEYAKAIAYYEKYIAGNPDLKSALVYNQLGLCYMQQKDYQKALDAFTKGIALNDNSVMQRLRYNQIASYESVANFDMALEQANEYVKLYPEDKDMEREVKFLKTRVKQEEESKEDTKNTKKKSKKEE